MIDHRYSAVGGISGAAGTAYSSAGVAMRHSDAKTEEPKGLKYDADKSRLDLVQWPLVTGIGDVLAYGAKKYEANNWQHVANGDDRYFAAAMRHLIAYRSGEVLDPESGLNHLAHAATNLMFLLHIQTKAAALPRNEYPAAKGQK